MTLRKIIPNNYWLVIFVLWGFNTSAETLPDTIEKIKASVVAVGTYDRLSSPSSKFLGTGFVVGNGQWVATNAHVINNLDIEIKSEKLVIYISHLNKAEVRNAKVIAVDTTHDLALINISGTPLSPLKLSKQDIREGELFAFTGFPIGAALGLKHVTHRGIISSITPIGSKAQTTQDLSTKQIRYLKNPYNIYQLDATAYPGNSGSPVYDLNTGDVVAIINKVLVKSTKESMLSDPSAITYAIPIKYLEQLIGTLN